MHIKQIIIEGFKSYRDRIAIEPFDKRHNLVVGRNGSGKSNFFSAIQFVLSDEFARLRPKERQALLHEGTGPKVLSAYVEIIFDNSDRRVPIENDELILRRVLSAEKDQYLLNNKVVPRQEVMNLLESAGFSNSNPYYIVKQGEINQMATASDSHRLKLLKEVTGTKVYDERRDESLLVLRETEGKVENIEELLRTIEERLSTLGEEKEELRQYIHFDNIRRVLEYIIHEVELNETKKKLAELQKANKEFSNQQEIFISDLQILQNLIKNLTCKTKETKKELTSLQLELGIKNNRYQELIKEKAKLELTIKDLTEEVQGDNKSKEKAEKELAELTECIKEIETELEKVKPQYESMMRIEKEYNRVVSLKKQKRKELYAKQGRGSQFTSKEERDRWIQNELKLLNKQLKDKRDHIDKLVEDLKRDAAKQVELTAKIENETQEMERQRVCIDDYNKQCCQYKKDEDFDQTCRNKMWRVENDQQQSLSSLKEELARADQALCSMVGKSILNGRDSVRKVLDTFEMRSGRDSDILEAYHGLVIENFSCEKSVYTAVEVTAGNRLFHHVVDSDKVSTQILKEMNNQNLPGEATFIPLNRMNVRDIDYPDDSDAMSMVSKLHYEQKYDKAIRYLFGKTLICRSLDVATKLARTTGLDCVTLEGDQVSSKGSLTGGYFDISRSRLKMQKTRSKLMKQIAENEDTLKGFRKELKKIENNINHIVSNMQKTETKNSKAKGIFAKVQVELRLMKEELGSIERSRDFKEHSLTQCKSSLESMQTTKEALVSELHQELLAQLSVVDQIEVDSLNDDIQRLERENNEAFSTRIKLESEKNHLDSLFTNNLNRRRDQVLFALREISLDDRKSRLINSRSELETVDILIDDVNKNLLVMEEKVKEMTKKLKDEQEQLEMYKIWKKEPQDKSDETAKCLEKYALKQNLLEQKITESVEKISQLGTLPVDDSLYSQYVKYSSRAVFKELVKTNNQLKKYSHVNQKASDQFKSVSDQKEQLQKRKEELDKGDEKIKELLITLEQRKREDLQFAFKQVSKYFSEVFQKLVPSGRAQLLVKVVDNEEGRDIAPEDTNPDHFSGIGVRVSFTESDAEMKEMNQLSGGQKSLVALGLIFAIQKYDPAPFYLFDEIDQSLDEQRRKAVANMIHELSGKAQFITTTFRPELFEHANKFYGVMFRNKVSHIECVSGEVVKDFLEDAQTHG